MTKPKKAIKLIKIESIRYAIELEAELPSSQDADKLIERGRTLNGWELKRDSSLENGIELSPLNSNKLYWNDESLLQIKEVLALLRVHRAKINHERCGLHIHYNIRNLEDKEILNIIKEFIHKQRYIAKRFNVHPKRLEYTCKLLPRGELHKLTEKDIHKARNNERSRFYNYSYLDEKHYSLNVNHISKEDYGSIEFRLFNGTLNFREIKEAIYFGLTFIKEAIERE